MTHKPIIDYFEQLNANLLDFPEKSFFRMDLAEIQGSFRSGINFPAMVVESPEGNTEGSTINASVINRTGAFTVYQNSKQGDFGQQNQLLDQCERIGIKILARMRLDNANPAHAMHNRFDIPGVTWIKVGPIFTEKLYGYRFMYDLRGTESLIVDPADWSDIDEVCS